jgi:hypothetical protein
MPLHINFWLFDGNPPADQNTVEIVIHSFQLTHDRKLAHNHIIDLSAGNVYVHQTVL